MSVSCAIFLGRSVGPKRHYRAIDCFVFCYFGGLLVRQSRLIAMRYPSLDEVPAICVTAIFLEENISECVW